MDLGIEGRIALVTGGSKGIGRGIARSLVDEGCHVAICARHEDELTDAQRALADRSVAESDVVAVRADLTREADRARLVSETEDRLGPVDILVNNAGTIGEGGTLADTPLQAWRDVFELNVFAVVDLCRRLVPGMRERGWGRVVNISSENGRQPYPDMMAYSATKGALDNFTKSLSKSCAGDGVLVNAVSPAFIMTPLVERMMEEAAEEQGASVETVVDHFLEEDRPHIELKRPGRIDEVGPVAAFLCSELASFVNGDNWRVDGGSVAAE